MRWGPNFVKMETQFLVKWGPSPAEMGTKNLLIKGESFVWFINGDPCGYSALFLFSVHTTPREFSQFEITKNAQNISLRPQPWT